MGKNTIYFGEETVEPTFEENVKSWKASKAKEFRHWLNSKSETYSMLCGENFTHKQVIVANAFCAATIAVVGLVEAHTLAAILVGLIAIPLFLRLKE
jgi:hypothetical protein